MEKKKVHNKYVFKFSGIIEVDGFGDTDSDARKDAFDKFKRMNSGDLTVTEYRTIVTTRIKNDTK